uniref:NADH-ubiquinone oxidoreductase chain 2 n=1 Tax=Nacospatangus altus TaxID=1357422 RepID=V9NJ96_9ECHN|nr:NADH dehydrogenase subunit 2 [Nacospatangus altus]AGQ49797.1 NADH dehydrogenase subunit 2 [Nacospatangus altus]
MHRTISTLLFLTIVFGTVIVVTSNNWFIIWIGLEISTLALIPLLCSNFSPRNVEATIKYFLIQAMSAALLLNGALIQAWVMGSWSILEPINNVTSVAITTALAFKIGLAPCHFWFPDVLQGLPFSSGLIVSTWQKIAPLVLLFSMNETMPTTLILALSGFSVLVGGWGGLNQTQTRKILAFSSIGNMGWIVATSIYSYNTALVMLIIYLIINTTMFLILDLLNVSTLGHLNAVAQLSPVSIALVVLTTLSLGGLPPLTGFMIKFFSLYTLITNNSIIISIPLVLGALLSLFFYLRMSFNTGLILFPHHIITLTSWRNSNSLTIISIKAWLVSCLFIASTTTMPLTVFLYVII